MQKVAREKGRANPPQKRHVHGHRQGERHPRARYTDTEIELMRSMHEELGYGYRRLAEIFECGRSYAQKVCSYTRRRLP